MNLNQLTESYFKFKSNYNNFIVKINSIFHSYNLSTKIFEFQIEIKNTNPYHKNLIKLQIDITDLPPHEYAHLCSFCSNFIDNSFTFLLSPEYLTITYKY